MRITRGEHSRRRHGADLVRSDGCQPDCVSGGRCASEYFHPAVFEIWINIGGSGATLALVVTMFLRSRSKQMKQLGKLAIGPAVFNINEPIIFGMPIVMNPMLLIPFIITPLVTLVLTYIGMSTGLVAKPAGIAVPWTMPPIFSGYLATGGKISGAVMQAINIITAFIVYYPFFRMWDSQKLKEENELEQSQAPAVQGDEKAVL